VAFPRASIFSKLQTLALLLILAPAFVSIGHAQEKPQPDCLQSVAPINVETIERLFKDSLIPVCKTTAQKTTAPERSFDRAEAVF
jgi:hypothetical protein